MTIYLVYGLTKDDSCDESYVKKAFKDKEKAVDYLYSGYRRYSFYAGKSKEDLRKEIEREIHEEELE